MECSECGGRGRVRGVRREPADGGGAFDCAECLGVGEVYDACCDCSFCENARAAARGVEAFGFILTQRHTAAALAVPRVCPDCGGEITPHGFCKACNTTEAVRERQSMEAVRERQLTSFYDAVEFERAMGVAAARAAAVGFAAAVCTLQEHASTLHMFSRSRDFNASDRSEFQRAASGIYAAARFLNGGADAPPPLAAALVRAWTDRAYASES